MFHFNCENEDFDGLASAVGQIGERYADVLERMAWVSLGGGIAFTASGIPGGPTRRVAGRSASGSASTCT